MQKEDDSFFKNKKLVEERKKRTQEKYCDESKNRLKKVVKKNCTTIMIAALDEFEKEFGDLWGNGQPEDQLTDEQRDMLEGWKYVREQILNRGNSKIRATSDEIDQYSISWKRYTYKFITKGEKYED